ncbi:uncharacterized protein L3040_004996 [Drepanopeziza brunnea f. sp. 'multigermtubi']|uniref:uncharacterized protein n=1 Tax=Drepanopeziza brunnea f. sp. 'multigermtubi' TaxID=698441 RepID=UPI0023A1EEF1|nr:hypothetical protein L3040_004996 [Drepanopeziza brunnea f. sp. 'multigermtubi']
MGLDMTTDGSHGDSTKLASASASALATKPAKPARKKFAVPPVKLACLECRASRTRCDGKTECSNCITRGKTCVYTQSKRGGSRIRRKRVSTESQSSPKFNNKELNQCALSIMPESEEGTFAAPLSLVAPGGGLKQLDFSLDDTDFIFDSIFATQQENMDSGYETSEHAGTLSDGGQREVPIRTYSSDEDILSAYYTYIHPYFPVLPPPEPGQVTDNPDLGIRRSPDAIFSSRSCPEFEPCSPLSMAISASLALIPHPDDKDPSGTESLHLRREQAQAFARSAFEGIEIESELIDSTVQPGEALSSDPLTLDRRPFHPRNPVENESIIALIMLSTYEYAQRGNVAKMRNRAGQAVNAAMNLGLHIKGDEEGYYAEANRRVWWMAYIAMQRILLTLALTPPILLYDPRFTTMGPTYSGDPGAWPIFLQSQQAITSATQFVIDLDATLKQGANTAAIWDRMLELEAIIEPLIMAADTWTLSSSPPLALDSSEMVVGQALRGIARIKLNSARIKLHRYCAFSDVPVFSKKHCDLPPTSRPAQDTNLLTPVSNTSTPNPAPNCACSNAFSSSFSPSHSSNHLSTPLSMGSSSNILPYNPTHSARICLKSAFAIARSFASLPYPQPCRPSSNPQTQLSQVPHSQNQHQNQSQELNHGQSQRQNPLSMEYPYFPSMSTTTTTTTTIASPATIAPAHPPRMIPVFACCAMQSSYALIMLSYKTKAMDFASSVSSSPSSFPPSYHHPTNTNTNTHTYTHTNANFANPNPSTGLARGDGKEPSSSAQRMLAQLGEGLQMILAALRNYSIAYEALGGMRDQIDIAATSVGAIAEQSVASGVLGGGGGW